MSTAQILAATETGSTALASEWTTLINLRSYHYVTVGPRDAPVLLFLHGYADSWRGAELLIPHLQDHFRIFALDQRGHGDSDRDFEHFSIVDFARDAVDFIEHVIGSDVTIVGHCLGGLVAQHVAAHHAHLVSRLILIGSTDSTHQNPALVSLQQSIAGDWPRVPNDFARSFRESTVARRLLPAQLEQASQESQRVRPIVWSKVASALIEEAKVAAHRIRHATLILWGEHDSFFDHSAQVRLQTALKQQKLIAYPDVGHAPNLEIPERVARDILAFTRQ
jgi:pimeloyl-ACP methyl ester carboxylesterase